jgi:hypothetical protein
VLNWKEKFPAGSIVLYFVRENNAPHHSTLTGRLIQVVQSFHKFPDPSCTHAGMISGFGTETPKDGNTQLHAWEILQGGTAGDRVVERHYAIEVYKLKDGHILKNMGPRITSEDLAKMASTVAKQFTGVPYDHSKLAKVALNMPRDITGKIEYVKGICKKFDIDLVNRTFTVDPKRHTLICPELVITSYQIAWILLLGPQAVHEPMPDFLNIHAHCTVAELTNFLRNNHFYEPVDPVATHQLMYSGTRHPNDPPDPEKYHGQDQVECVQHVVNFARSFYVPSTMTNTTPKAKI